MGNLEDEAEESATAQKTSVESKPVIASLYQCLKPLLNQAAVANKHVRPLDSFCWSGPFPPFFCIVFGAGVCSGLWAAVLDPISKKVKRVCAPMASYKLSVTATKVSMQSFGKVAPSGTAGTHHYEFEFPENDSKHKKMDYLLTGQQLFMLS